VSHLARNKTKENPISQSRGYECIIRGGNERRAGERICGHESRTHEAAHRKEVVTMFLEEYDEELHYRTLRREGYEDGEARIRLLHEKFLDDKRMDDLYRSLHDKTFEEKLCTEYGL
jgi:hypothetical protein